MSVQQPSALPNTQPSTSHLGDNGGVRVEVDTQTDFAPPADDLDALLHGKAFHETDVAAVATSKQSHPHIEMQVIQAPQAPTPVIAQTPLRENDSPPAKAATEPTVVAKDKAATDAETTTEEKPSAWRRFVDGINHDPLNDPEFVEAYHVWQKQNRKERYDRRRAWIVAHWCKVGCLLGFVKKDRKDEAWEAYKEKLAYMED
ncbi:hypothetical protein QFC24_002504 [Naganishia onofrii]|uniref:Uncharacterized protein n=1 Tax=Naganishia onofrii TaxID=1851511 RepID=A0ACC2XQ14_9TREE|nr:hypothetical protein QFC24_002504 [Naganishia onofrii]